MLKIFQLSYSIGKKQLIRNISLEFSPGHLYGILGPNGSGKTTLLKSLSGIWKPSSGTIFWGGKDLISMDRKEISKILTLVPQNPQISFDFTVKQMVAMGRYPHSRLFFQKEKEHRVKEALEIVDAWQLKDRRVAELSHGERQRVYIARALAVESPILLLDEPTASLDIQHQLEIWDLLRLLNRKGKIIIVTTHDLVMAERFCDRLVILQRGECISSGTFCEALPLERLAQVFGVKTQKICCKRFVGQRH